MFVQGLIFHQRNIAISGIFLLHFVQREEVKTSFLALCQWCLWCCTDCCFLLAFFYGCVLKGDRKAIGSRALQTNETIINMGLCAVSAQTADFQNSRYVSAHACLLGPAVEACNGPKTCFSAHNSRLANTVTTHLSPHNNINIPLLMP